MEKRNYDGQVVNYTEVDDEKIKGIFSTRKYSPNYFKKVKDKIQRYVTEDGSEDVIDTMMDFNYVITKNIKSSIPKWVDAVRYCQLSLNMSGVEAWKRTFPDRVEDVRQKYDTQEEQEKQITHRATTYSQGKMVSSIKEDMLIPTHIMYAGVRKKGVQKQIDLMNGKASVSLVPKYMRDEKGKLILDKYGQRQFLYIKDVQQFEEVHQVVTPKIQQEAAKMIIEITTAPETLKIEANVSHFTDTAVMKQNVEVMNRMREFAMGQREAALGGADINELQQVAHIMNIKEEE